MADGLDPTATGGAGDEPASADGELVGLSGASGYESTDEMDGPSAVLEDEALVGVAPTLPAISTAQRDRTSPTRSQSVSTGAVEQVKKLSEAQERPLRRRRRRKIRRFHQHAKHFLESPSAYDFLSLSLSLSFLDSIFSTEFRAGRA